MSAFIPQHDPDKPGRDRDLVKMRGHYRYNHTYLSPLAMVERLPNWEEPAWNWIVSVGHKALEVMINHAENDGDPVRRDATHARHGFFTDFVKRATGDFRMLSHLIGEAVGANVLHGPPKSLEGYEMMFRSIGLPPISRDFMSDHVFGEMRLAGPNPVVLQRVTQPPDHFPVTQADFADSMSPDDTLEAAGREGRLFLLDYRILEGIENSTYPDVQKYVYAPLCLMAVHKTKRILLPVAIQCQQVPGPTNPIFTPVDGASWKMAKTIIKVADGTHHEAITHLGRTHLFIEPFVVATQRQLAANHPLGILLRPHFEGTLSINNMARSGLVNEKGPVDELLGGTIKSTVELTVKGMQTQSFDRVMLPNTFKERGVDDTHALPQYPYRDDSMLYWKAIHKWVTAYLELYYQSDADTQHDHELSAWFDELVAADGGRVAGLVKGLTHCTVNYLADAATLIIFTSSVQHAAVNFPQFDLMSYVPNMPLASYSPAPTEKGKATEEDWLAMLPPLNHANLQMSLGVLLGSIRYTVLGHYGEGRFPDPRVAPLVKHFQDELRSIGHTIEQRNKARRPYDFLLPAGIPQSINI